MNANKFFAAAAITFATFGANAMTVVKAEPITVTAKRVQIVKAEPITVIAKAPAHIAVAVAGADAKAKKTV
jgi:hypothetical protein